ncbi:MAG: hypothetical protein H7A36_04525 [Chlamydiales bacterium]|nr:hypothetical protein [Chlamydiales bacterium]
MRIDILTRNSLPYTFENYAATLLEEELEKKGIECRRISDLGPYLYEVRANPPDWTLAFEDVIGKQTPLCDILCIPHFHWERESLERVSHLLRSRFGEVGFHEKVEGVHYLPLPAQVRPRLEPQFEVVAFFDVTEKSAPFVEKFECRVDIFGAHKGKNWLVRLKNAERVHLHMPLPYTEKLRAFQMSALCVVPPHLFAPAVLCGCLPVSAENAQYFLENALEREKECARLTEKLLACHSWPAKTEELLKCLSR